MDSVHLVPPLTLEDRILSNLNEAQKEAVTHGDGPCLVLAGAGSGKTRVLTHRVAFLMERRGIPGGRILAVTFTNKAASEMKTRIRNLTGSDSGVWVSTFHSFCAKVLRRWGRSVGIEPGFSIYDRDDQKSVAKKCLEEAGISTKTISPGTLLEIISGAKNRLITPDILERTQNTTFGSTVSSLYRLYQEKMRSLGALDFDDLLIETYRIFAEHEEILEYYRSMFLHILVDEFQDTNRIQYLLLKKLASKTQNIFVVGDDDQSIYGWRGAEIKNILNFPKDFPGTRVIKLEKNYRSTRNIIVSASHIISHNRSRWGKTLHTVRGEGEPVYVFGAYDQHDEARFVVKMVEKLRKRYRLKDMAVLYRVNAQSRVLEEELLKAGIPHTIVGGVKFYERKEIKDIIAYLRFMVNPRDEISFLRILNTPPRGIGKATAERIRNLSQEKGLPMPITFIEHFEELLRGRAKKRAKTLLNLLSIKDMEMPLSEKVERVIKTTGYREYIMSMGKEELSRLENIQELLSVVKEFEEVNPKADIEDFLEFVGLMTDIDTYSEEDDRLTLMTIHSSKGLEFPVVFITGLEEGLFPLNMRFYNTEHVGDIEEETRLMYVAMTRAKDLLFLSYAEERLIFGRTYYNEPSRFISFLPSENTCYLPREQSPWYQNH